MTVAFQLHHPRFRTKSVVDVPEGFKLTVAIHIVDTFDDTTGRFHILVAAIRDGEGGPNLAIERGSVEFDDPGTPNDGSWNTSTKSREVVEFDHGFASKPVVVFPSSTHPGGVIEQGRLTKDSVELVWRFYASFDSSATTVRWLAVGEPA